MMVPRKEKRINTTQSLGEKHFTPVHDKRIHGAWIIARMDGGMVPIVIQCASNGLVRPEQVKIVVA
ncbi:MAG: hypothetical protein LBF93_06840 [Zoogloeaceae bacterium]|nr:hypothetical protein [Zoogloeaceae bacterium]